MSDPVTNVDIEDVLASIRRLVSGGAEQDRAAPARNEAAERLVLTPSQRIDEEDQSEQDQSEQDQSEQDQSEQDQPEQDVFAAEPVVTNDDVSKSDHLPESESDFEAEGESVAETTEDEADQSAVERTVQSSDMWEPDGDDEDAFADASEAPRLEWRDADTEFAPEAMSFDPDEMAADDLASDSFARSWDAEDEDAPAAFELDEAVLDEEALRDLVAEIVREELMGTLGERITRNVRKLVRREIHRALTSQDFD
jgi:hypothetical protein